MGRIRPFYKRLPRRSWAQEHTKSWWFGRDRDEEDRQVKYPFDPQRELLPAAPLLRQVAPATVFEAVMQARPNEDPVDHSTMQQPMRDHLDAAIERLPVEDQELLWWLFWQRESMENAGKALGITRQGVRGRIRRILRELGDYIAPMLFEEREPSNEWVADREWVDGLPVPALKSEREDLNVERGGSWARKVMKVGD